MPKYSILESVLLENPNFNNLELLTEQIEKETIQISDEIIDHLKKVNWQKNSVKNLHTGGYS